MTEATPIEQLVAEQDELQREYEIAQEAMQEAKAKHDIRKAALAKFNNKYGRVLQMMREG